VKRLAGRGQNENARRGGGDRIGPKLGGVDGLTIPDAARILGISPRELREAVERGELHAVRISGRWTIPRESLSGPGHEAQASGGIEVPAAGGDSTELVKLRSRVEELEHRIAALERPRHRGTPMREALRPLFRDFSPPDEN
jgi:excisionase family DNA binding protein